MTFDGANIWVTHLVSGSVTKVQKSDCSNLGNFFVGTIPLHIASDGDNVWVSSNTTLTKLASNGANLGNFSIASNGIAFDGNNLWVTSFSNVIKLQPSDGQILATYPVGPNNLGPIAFDGANIWAATDNGNVTKLRPSDGATLATFTVAQFPTAIASDGSCIWIGNGTNIVTRITQ
jgi:hypothetical protein